MGCKCNEVTTVLRCTACGRIQTISHSKKEAPLEEAKKQNRTCKKCYGTDFEIG